MKRQDAEVKKGWITGKLTIIYGHTPPALGPTIDRECNTPYMQSLQLYSAEMPLNGLAPQLFLCGLTAKQNKANHSHAKFP